MPNTSTTRGKAGATLDTLPTATSVTAKSSHKSASR